MMAAISTTPEAPVKSGAMDTRRGYFRRRAVVQNDGASAYRSNSSGTDSGFTVERERDLTKQGSEHHLVAETR
jgi:hypothetical protein